MSNKSSQRCRHPPLSCLLGCLSWVVNMSQDTLKQRPAGWNARCLAVQQNTTLSPFTHSAMPTVELRLNARIKRDET